MGLVDAVVLVVEVDNGVVTTGMVGTVGRVVPVVVVANGDALSVGNVAQELTPRLAISAEPNGIPVLGLPPGVVGVVDVGAEGDRPLEPGLHIPDTPTVPIAEVVDIPPVGNAPGSIDTADGATPGICALPDVAVVADPIAIPPPS